jgi:hypothetical protein
MLTASQFVFKLIRQIIIHNNFKYVYKIKGILKSIVLYAGLVVFLKHKHNYCLLPLGSDVLPRLKMYLSRALNYSNVPL